MWLKWLPWKFVVRRMARSRGFLDPFALLARLRRFAQPSEVSEPIELLRAGVVFHARGLLNSRVIQHNLDWVWPYWVERQFDPRDVSFVPRAFSLTHVNLTHRNWTAVGLPNCAATPIVDPHGLVTPFLDGWSLDFWIVTDGGEELLPSRLPSVVQRLELEGNLAVTTAARVRDLSLSSSVGVNVSSGEPTCRIQLHASAHTAAQLVVALRPCNPEGVSFVHEVKLNAAGTGWEIDGEAFVEFSEPCRGHALSGYTGGDVHVAMRNVEEHGRREIRCDVGMATAAVMFRMEPGKVREVVVSVPLSLDRSLGGPALQAELSASWEETLQGGCRLEIADERIQFLYDAAVRTLLLHSSEEVYPGPYTYKRFWFRDSAFILHGLLCAGFIERVERLIDRFPSRQTPFGYFHSQDGEWDSNGEALWIMRRLCDLSGRAPKKSWEHAIRAAARWIHRKRSPESPDGPHAGLLPAGFSAEHLGPNDFYYWDDFWGVGGLRAAAAMVRSLGDEPAAREFEHEAEEFARAIDRSLAKAAARLGRAAIPASASRRLDAGAIGSLAIGYPLQLCAADDPRLIDTLEFLLERCLVHGGFFQDMIHSGINPYLTLHLAQVLLRAGDPRYYDLMSVVAGLASPTGQWPEAVHPRTRGGCMGDGQHVWAAAEWVLMVRNCFVREEGENRLILGSGLQEGWLAGGSQATLGPAPTPFGPITVSATKRAGKVEIAWEGRWRGREPRVEIRVPGHEAITASTGQTKATLALPQGD